MKYVDGSTNRSTTDCQFVSIDGMPAGGMMQPVTSGQEPGWFFNVAVADMDAAIGRAIEAGGTVIRGPFEIAGGQRIAQCVDPQGVTFGIVTVV
jgi:predicted enzyme related to lactoylglutathione lyase